MSHSQLNEKQSDEERPTTSTTLSPSGEGVLEPGDASKSEPDVLVVDWDGPDDPDNPRK